MLFYEFITLIMNMMTLRGCEKSSFRCSGGANLAQKTKLISNVIFCGYHGKRTVLREYQLQEYFHSIELESCAWLLLLLIQFT